MPAWTNAFSQPAPVTGLSLYADPTTSLVTLSWTASPLALTLFDHYRIERQTGEDPWEYAGEQTVRDDPTYIDREAPSGVTVRYRVRVSIGSTDFDSEPLDGEVVSIAGFYYVEPGQDGAAVRLIDVESFSISSDGTVSMSLLVHIEEREIIAALEGAATGQPYVMVKNGQGVVVRGRLSPHVVHRPLGRPFAYALNDPRYGVLERRMTSNGAEDISFSLVRTA